LQPGSGCTCPGVQCVAVAASLRTTTASSVLQLQWSSAEVQGRVAVQGRGDRSA
jgi:hypothetical protein